MPKKCNDCREHKPCKKHAKQCRDCIESKFCKIHAESIKVDSIKSKNIETCELKTKNSSESAKVH